MSSSINEAFFLISLSGLFFWLPLLSLTLYPVWWKAVTPSVPAYLPQLSPGKGQPVWCQRCGNVPTDCWVPRLGRYPLTQRRFFLCVAIGSPPLASCPSHIPLRNVISLGYYRRGINPSSNLTETGQKIPELLSGEHRWTNDSMIAEAFFPFRNSVKERTNTLDRIKS